MTHAQKLRWMSTALGVIVLGVVLWVVWQAAIATNDAAAFEERDRWCTEEGISSARCFDSSHDEAFESSR